MTKLFESQTITQKKAQANFEVYTISSMIIESLLNKEACEQTLSGVSIVNGTTLAGIKNKAGNVIFNTTRNYGSNDIKINSFTIRDVVTGDLVNGTKFGNLKVEVEFEKVSKLLQNKQTSASRIRTKSFSLQVGLDASDRIVKCFSSTENAVAAARDEACLSIGGVFDNATNNCNLSAFNASGTLSDSVAVSTQSQRDFFDDAVVNELDTRFVNTTGDTMTGGLRVSNQICVGSNCRNFLPSACPVGQVAKEIRATGTVVCANITCPNPATFFVGINALGDPICKAFPTNTCGANEYVSRVFADGSVSCSILPAGTNKNCPVGSFIQSIDAAGNHVCASDISVVGKSCSSSELLRGFDASGNPICVTGYLLISRQIYSINAGMSDTRGTLNLPGSWLMCSLNSHTRSHGNSGSTESCTVAGDFNGSWRIGYNKRTGHTLRCAASNSRRFFIPNL